MKKLFVIALGFLLDPLATLAQPAVLIAEYRFDTISPGGTRLPYYVNPLVLSYAGKFYNSTGVLPITSPAGFYANGPNSGTQPTDRSLIARNWLPTFSATKYFGDTLRPVVGQTLVIDSVTLRALSSSQGPASAQMRENVTNYSVTTGSVLANTFSAPWKKWKIVPGSMLSSATLIDFRLYAYGTSGGTGTTWRIDSLRVYGHLDNIYNLPVELTHLSATPENSVVKLDWSTATEKNNSHFTVYRSKDLKTWEEVTRVTGAGNSQSSISYETVDDKPFAGISYYNLQQTDFDNKSRDVGTVSVQMKESNSFTFLLYQEFSWGGQTTAIFDTSGRMISGWNTVHTLTSPGIFLLVTRQGETAKIHITP